MNAFVFVYIVVLFVVLTPGMLVSLPVKGGKYVVAFTHAVVFAAVWWITHKFVWQLSLQVGA
jgi:hypothetical protein